MNQIPRYLGICQIRLYLKAQSHYLYLPEKSASHPDTKQIPTDTPTLRQRHGAEALQLCHRCSVGLAVHGRAWSGFGFRARVRDQARVRI